MAQMGLFAADKRLKGLSAKGDPLVGIFALAPWETFRGDIEVVVLTAEDAKKIPADRKPTDALALFRMLVLQSLYNLSDAQVEYQVRDRLSFTRFLGLGFEAGVPDGATLWQLREKLAKAGLIDKLFERFGQPLEAKGYIARGGQMVDATIVPAPRQRNSREFDGLLNQGNTSRDVYADSAYRSTETERKLKRKTQGFRSRIHKRGRRNRPLTEAEAQANHRKSKVRARIGHVFGAQENAPGGRLVRTIGIVRAEIRSGFRTSCTTSAGWRSRSEWRPRKRRSPPKRRWLGRRIGQNGPQSAERLTEQALAAAMLTAQDKPAIVRGALKIFIVDN